MNVIHKDAKEGIFNLPIWGNAADVAQGCFLKKGTTPATQNGALIPATGAGAHADLIGRLQSKLTYATDAETLVAGTSFVTKPVKLAQGFRVHKLQYQAVAAGTGAIVCTQAVSTTTLTLTNWEDDTDASFLYVVGGTGIGQTNYLTAAAVGSCTLKAAFGTSLDTTSYLIKILPKFHTFGILSTDGTQLASQAAVGSTTIVVLDSYIERNGRMEQLNPTKHAALTGLNNLRSVRFWADVAFRDTVPYSID